MRGQYIYDDNYKLKKAKTSAWTRVRRVLVFFVASLSMAVLYYVIFALVFSPDINNKLVVFNQRFCTCNYFTAVCNVIFDFLYCFV